MKRLLEIFRIWRSNRRKLKANPYEWFYVYSFRSGLWLAHSSTTGTAYWTADMRDADTVHTSELKSWVLKTDPYREIFTLEEYEKRKKEANL